MKKLLLLLLCIGMALAASAQMTRRPRFRPDWVFQAPRPTNGTYLYVVEHGEGFTKREALNQALGRVFQSTANRIGTAISTDEVNRAVQSGTDYEVIARNMKVPINKVCEFPVQDSVTNMWTMYILCQVAKAGNIVPEFEATDECTKHDMYNKLVETWEQQQKNKEEEQKRLLRKVNGKAMAASMFVPGLGQMLKGKWGAGAGILTSEVLLLGGGTACYFLGQAQISTMNARGTTYDAYTAAKNMKSATDIAMYSCFGAAGAIYIFNLCHAYLCQPTDKGFKRLSYYPAIIPTNEYINPTYAYGVGVQYKF